ncbi:hypothetical protein RUM43_014721 [Polyplax serrata]|uniref:Uncharacterized protein n=1 Tax=Polyplax serrata TaxID=468196 RepID=A0AAN8P4K1_POLSC
MSAWMIVFTEAVYDVKQMKMYISPWSAGTYYKEEVGKYKSLAALDGSQGTSIYANYGGTKTTAAEIVEAMNFTKSALVVRQTMGDDTTLLEVTWAEANILEIRVETCLP